MIRYQMLQRLMFLLHVDISKKAGFLYQLR